MKSLFSSFLLLAVLLVGIQKAQADTSEDWELCLNSRVVLGPSFPSVSTDFYYPRANLEAADRLPQCQRYWANYVQLNPQNAVVEEAQRQLRFAMDNGWIADLRADQSIGFQGAEVAAPPMQSLDRFDLNGQHVVLSSGGQAVYYDEPGGEYQGVEQLRVNWDSNRGLRVYEWPDGYTRAYDRDGVLQEEAYID